MLNITFNQNLDGSVSVIDKDSQYNDGVIGEIDNFHENVYTYWPDDIAYDSIKLSKNLHESELMLKHIFNTSYCDMY